MWKVTYRCVFFVESACVNSRRIWKSFLFIQKGERKRSLESASNERLNWFWNPQKKKKANNLNFHLEEGTIFLRIIYERCVPLMKLIVLLKQRKTEIPRTGLSRLWKLNQSIVAEEIREGARRRREKFSHRDYFLLNCFIRAFHGKLFCNFYSEKGKVS